MPKNKHIAQRKLCINILEICSHDSALCCIRQANRQNDTEGIFPYIKFEKNINGKNDIHRKLHINTIFFDTNMISVSLHNVQSAIAAIMTLNNRIAVQFEKPNNEPNPA